MKPSATTQPLDFAGSPRRDDAAEARRRHFASANRWAHQLPIERSRADKRKAYELMISNVLAGLKCGEASR